MVQQEILVSNVLGIHARPAALIVQLSTKFASEVWLEKDNVKADAKSIMSVMMLAAAYQSKILICAQRQKKSILPLMLLSIYSSLTSTRVNMGCFVPASGNDGRLCCCVFCG